MIKVILAGIGGYGELHLKHLFKLSDAGRVDVAGLVEPYPDSCKSLEDIKSRGWRIFSSLSEFYAQGECDLVCIATPIAFHTPMIIEALEHGSNVLCEKPLTGDISDIPKLIEAREKSGKFVMVGYQWSYSDAILSMKRDILSGDLGEPEYFKTLVLWPRNKAYFNRGSGWAGRIKAKDGTLILDSVANNAAAHYLHNIFFTLGSELDSALAPEKVDAKLMRANPIENFDTAVISCEFENGVRSLYAVSHTVDKSIGPLFEYKFSKGVISYKNGDNITATLDSGEKRIYGDPYASNMLKIDIAVENIEKQKRGEAPFIPCGIETATAQVKCIAECAKLPIEDAPVDKIRIGKDELTYVEGLADKLLELYNNEI